tara:strand:- start:264 stop:1640 length:1377 start_codon:yes stop_codon:yes gene_type:complete
MNYRCAKIILSVGSLISLAAFSAPDYRLTREFWNSPEFVRSFMGDYGFRTEIEPKVSRTEQQVLREASARAQNDLGEAVQYLSGKMKTESSAALDFAFATMEFQLGRLGAAALGYRKAIEKFPNFLRAHKNLGFVLIQQDSFNEAAKHLAKSLSLGEGDGITYTALGYCHLALERFISAENAYRMAILRSPENKDARNGLVNCLLETERQEEALSLLDELLEKDPENVFCRRARANALIALDKLELAAVALETLRRLDKLDPGGLLLLGDAYHNLELNELSLDAYQECLQGRGNLSAGRFMRVASILIDRGSYQAGFRYLDQIEQQFADGMGEDDQLQLLALKANIKLTTGQDDEAAKLLKQILEKNPLDGKALLLLGTHAWKKGSHAEASIHFERAAKVKEHEVKALIQNARMQVELREYEKAVELLERAQFLKPQEDVGRYLSSVRNAMIAAKSYR